MGLNEEQKRHILDCNKYGGEISRLVNEAFKQPGLFVGGPVSAGVENAKAQLDSVLKFIPRLNSPASCSASFEEIVLGHLEARERIGDIMLDRAISDDQIRLDYLVEALSENTQRLSVEQQAKQQFDGYTPFF